MAKKILVTSALPYVNNLPHLGTMIPILSADAYSRFLKLKKENVVFVCGTDEHGTTTEIKAIEEGVTPRKVSDKYFGMHKKVYEWFECDFNCFGRSSSDENHRITQDIFLKLDKNGYILEQSLEQLYCGKCGRFLADRFVEGTCPHCGYEGARGDQCENCGKLLNATDLKNPKCKICGTKPIVKETKHLFIDLPKIEPRLRKWISTVKKTWTTNAINMTESWLKDGLRPRCITRDLKWGIPVPKKGFENKVFYSWFDAPIAYISITAEGRKDWEKWWKDEKTELVQFMGKDNIPFHTILFPSFLIGTNDTYTLVKKLSVNEYLNYGTGKFSKSKGTGVFGDDAMSLGMEPGVWRYYILVSRPEKSDTEFTWKDFQEKLNNELLANFGNLVHRTLFFVNKYYDSTVAEANDKFDYSEELEKITKLLEEIELRSALKEIMLLAKKGNQYLQENEPWKNPEDAKTKKAIANLVNLVKDLSILAWPFMPGVSEKIQKMLNVKINDWNDLGKKSVKKGHKINESMHLFKKLEDKEVKIYEERFRGKSEVSKFDFRVGKVISAADHPNADKLYVLKVRLDRERQLVAGLKGYMNKDDIVGKNVIVVANLKPAKLKGIESQGMLLAAEKNGKVVLLEAPKSNLNDRAIFKEGSPAAEVTIDEFAKLKITIKGKKVLLDSSVLKTSSEEVKANIEDGAAVK